MQSEQMQQGCGNAATADTFAARPRGVKRPPTANCGQAKRLSLVQFPNYPHTQMRRQRGPTAEPAAKASTVKASAMETAPVETAMAATAVPAAPMTATGKGIGRSRRHRDRRSGNSGDH